MSLRNTSMTEVWHHSSNTLAPGGNTREELLSVLAQHKQFVWNHDRHVTLGRMKNYGHYNMPLLLQTDDHRARVNPPQPPQHSDVYRPTAAALAAAAASRECQGVAWKEDLVCTAAKLRQPGAAAAITKLAQDLKEPSPAQKSALQEAAQQVHAQAEYTAGQWEPLADAPVEWLEMDPSGREQLSVPALAEWVPAGILAAYNEAKNRRTGRCPYCVPTACSANTCFSPLSHSLC
jgi:hypothetical protein